MSQKQIPMWAVMAMEKKNRYGSIPDLPDEELADPEELLRQVHLQEWGAVLALPLRGSRSIRPDIDEDGGVSWGAFGTVDFERISPKFDKPRYKIDKLREERRNLKLMIDTVRYRVSDPNRYVVWKYFVRGVIRKEHILDEDLLALVELTRRLGKLSEEITRLQEARERRKERAAAAMLRRWE